MENIDSNPISSLLRWKYPENKFVYEKDVFLKQTTVMGNTYFSHYVEWQGEAREKFFLTHPAALIFMRTNPGLTLVTHSVTQHITGSTSFGDKVRIEVTTRDIEKYSMKLAFHFYSKKKLIGDGWQEIGFTNGTTNRKLPIPQLFLDLAESVKQST